MSVFSKISQFAQSPQGRRLIGEAQRRAKDPKTRAQLDSLKRRVAGRGGQSPR